MASKSITSATITLLPDPPKPGAQYTIRVRCNEGQNEPLDNATYKKRDILDQVLMSYNGLTVSDITPLAIKNDLANFSQWQDDLVSIEIVNKDGDGFCWTPENQE